MRIGIDIDDTISNTWQHVMPAYSKIFNIPMEEIKKSLPYYNIVKDKISVKEYFDSIRKTDDELAKTIPLKENVKDVLDKLSQAGHKIIFITARGGSYTDAYKTTKQYLDDNQIPYDKIVVNALNKGTVCVEEEIDIFIDDSIKHCEEAVEQNIEVLMFETKYNQSYDKIKHVKTWKEVENYIQSR